MSSWWRKLRDHIIRNYLDLHYCHRDDITRHFQLDLRNNSTVLTRLLRSLGDKQPTNDNATQRYSRVHIDIHASFLAHTAHDQSCLGTASIYPWARISAEYYPKGFWCRDESPALNNPQCSTSLILRCTNIHFLTPLWVPPGLHFLQCGLPTSARSAFNVYASCPVLQHILPWCLSRSVFVGGVLWLYGVPQCRGGVRPLSLFPVSRSPALYIRTLPQTT